MSQSELETFPEYRIRPIDELIPYARNARTHSAAQVAQIAASIKEFGFLSPIIMDGSSGILAGHGRVMAAQKLGLQKLPTIEAAHLSAAQRRAYVLADNQLAMNAGWDLELVKVELIDLQQEGFGWDVIGFDDDFLADLFAEEVKTEANPDDDKLPELPPDPITKTGDVWTMGRHRLRCGDSTDAEGFAVLMDGAKADFCFTSPPYNAALKTARGNNRIGGGGLYSGGYSDDRTSAEYIQFNADILATLATVAAENFTCCYNINYNKNSPSEYIDVIHAAKQCLPLVETIVWEKQMAVSLQGDNLTRIYEFVFVLCKGKFKINKNRTECLKNLWKISNIGANHESHKACFPVALVEEGIKNFCPHGGTVVEPFGGSGTSVIAAEKLGCTARCMELDPKYCDLIVKRWQDFTGQKAVHADTGLSFDQMLDARDAAAETA